jgi:hypothetical protein
MTIQLEITGEGMNVDKTITLTQAGKIIAFLGSEETPIGPTDEYRAPGAQLLDEVISPPQRQSLRELIDNAKATTFPQKIVVLGNYVAGSNPETVFTAESVKSLFVKTRDNIPTHFSRDLQAAVKSGQIEELPDKKDTYFVTRAGEEILQSGFGGNSATRKRSTKKASGGQLSSEGIRPEVLSVKVITPDLDGYLNYHKMPSKGAKVMWILAFANSNQIEELTPREVSYIANKLRDRIDQGGLSALTITAAKNGWVTKVEGNYTLLHKGDEYLKDLTIDDQAS